MTKQTTEKICYGCREMYGDRDDHKCVGCQHNIYTEEFWFEGERRYVANPDYRESEDAK